MSRREFHFSEGSSNKFWAITVDGKEFTVEFGRIGTKGQTQTKKFADTAAARTAADKLIAEKTKKGYREVGAAQKPATGQSSAKGKTPAKKQSTEQAAPAPVPIAPTVTRTIDLKPSDWLRATWRPRDPYVTPVADPLPFDQEACVKQFRWRVKSGDYSEWDKIRLRMPLSREEAHFWALAATKARRNQKTEKIAAELARRSFDGNVTLTELKSWIHKGFPDGRGAVQLAQALAVLLSPNDFLALALDELVAEQWGLQDNMERAFGEYINPHLTAREIEPLCSLLRPHVRVQDWSQSPAAMPGSAFFFAAMLGLHEEMLALVKTWPDGEFAPSTEWDECETPQWIVLGLGSARLVETHMRRLQIRLASPEILRAWLANTEFAGLDLVRDAIQAQTSREQAEKMLSVFRLVKAPEAAQPMLELKLNSKAPALARQWLDDNPGNAIAGLIPVAAGRGKLAEAAVEYLRAAKQQGHGAFIEEQLKSAAPEVAARLRQEERAEAVREPLNDAATPKWLQTAMKSIKTSALPSWVHLANLPPLVVEDRRLNDTQMTAVLSALYQSPLGKPSPLVQAIKEHIDPAVRDAFVWKLFERWLGEGAPSKEKWALLAIGHLGGDGAALKLTPLLRAWPGESQHQRAVLGLECLRTIGSDTALMQLNGIAQKLKFQGLKKKAQEFMEAIAKDRGMSRTQLEDRIVPDLDLDERGTRVFDFGSRQFTIVLDADLKPMVRDEAGKLKSDLPKPGTKDDADKANAALADWKLLKKQLRETIKVQAFRLEQAMVVGRRWKIQEFEQLLVRHPLMINLVRRLVWGGYDKKGKLVRGFRVTEEREYADSRDEKATLDGLVAAGIVHPLHLSEDERSAWGQVFGDYEIISPFPQLGRPVLALDKEETKGKEIKRFADVKIPAGALLGTTEKLGWTRGSADDHGVIQEFIKQFPSADVTAVLENEEGVMLGLGLDASGDQKITRCFFLRGLYTPESYPYHKDLLPLKDIDPLAVSEVLADLTNLASKGT